MPFPKKKFDCIKCKYKSSCFKTLSDEELNYVNENRVEVDFKTGEIICKQGTFATNIFYLRTGLVKLYIEGNPKNLIVKVIPQGNLIGLPALSDNNTFQYSVSAYVDTTVCMIDISVFQTILEKNSFFAKEVLNVVNKNTIQNYERFFSLTRKHLHGRLADILLCLSVRIYKSREFKLDLGRKDLAEITGMSTESVIRLLKEFKDSNLISISGKSIKILDKERLINISEKG